MTEHTEETEHTDPQTESVTTTPTIVESHATVESNIPEVNVENGEHSASNLLNSSGLSSTLPLEESYESENGVIETEKKHAKKHVKKSGKQGKQGNHGKHNGKKIPSQEGKQDLQGLIAISGQNLQSPQNIQNIQGIQSVYISPYSQKILVEEERSPIKDFLSKRKQQLHNQKEIQSRIEKNQKQKAEMILYAGAPKSLEDINITMGLDIITARNYELTSLMGLDCRPELKSLNLHYNYLVSFKYLQTQPQLEEIHIPMNTICSFYGLSFQPKLKWVNLNGNPIVRHGLYRIMCLIVANLNIKTIGKKPVLTKEKKLAENYISLFPQVKDAIRAGWLIDLENHPKCEILQENDSKRGFDSIINSLHCINMDDAEEIKQTEQFKKLIAGEYSYKFEVFEKFVESKIKSINKATSATKKKTANKDSKIKTLKKKIEKLKLDLKQQRTFSQQQMQIQEQIRAQLEKSLRSSIEASLRESMKEEITKEILENSTYKQRSLDSNSSTKSQETEVETPQKRNNSTLTVEDIVYFDVLQCHSFTYVHNDYMTNTEKRCNKIRLQFSVDAVIVITQDDLVECEILYSDILKNGFFLGDTGLARIRISLVNGDSVDLFAKQSGLARSAFKALHMFIEAHKQSIKPLTSPGVPPRTIVRSFSKRRVLPDTPSSIENTSTNTLFSDESTSGPKSDAIGNGWSNEDGSTSPETVEYMTIEREIISSIQSEISGRNLPPLPSSDYQIDEESADPNNSTESDFENITAVATDATSTIESDSAVENKNLIEANTTVEAGVTTIDSDLQENSMNEYINMEGHQPPTEESLHCEEASQAEFQNVSISENVFEENNDYEDINGSPELSTVHENYVKEDNTPSPQSSSIIEAPILRKHRHQVPEPETSTFESPKLRPGEDTEAILLAKEEKERKEREMRELFEAYQKVANEYGRERASQWLKEELSKLSPQERTRKELEVLERYQLVKHAKTLFERGSA